MEVTKFVLFGISVFTIVYTLVNFMRVTKDEAREMGIVTPEMARDPEELLRIERETPIGVKRALQEAEEASKESYDLVEGKDGVMRRNKY